jgi:hypothetical protein
MAQAEQIERLLQLAFGGEVLLPSPRKVISSRPKSQGRSITPAVDQGLRREGALRRRRHNVLRLVIESHLSVNAQMLVG